MLSLAVTLAACDSTDPRDMARVYTNLDGRGIAAGDLNATPDQSDVPLFSAGSRTLGEQYLEGAYLDEEYLAAELDGALVFRATVGPVCFGRVKVGVQAIDAAGNAQSGAVAVEEVTVNSPPRPATRLAMAAWTAGQQWFRFSESPQLRVGGS